MKTQTLASIVSAAGILFSGFSTTVNSDDIQFIPENLNYSRTLVDVCAPKKICAINRTDQAITDPGFTLTGVEVFEIQAKFQTCPNPLLPGEACIVYVDFCPEFVRDYHGTLNFSGTSRVVNLHGEGVSPAF